MSKARHARRRFVPHGWWAVLLIAFGGVLILAGGSAYAAYRYEAARQDRILPGVRIAGIDVSGMTRREALQAVKDQVNVSLSSRLTVKSAGKKWDVTPAELGVRADVKTSVQRAVAVAEGYTWWQRAYFRLRDKPVGQSFKLRFAYNRDDVDAFVQKIAGAVHVDPIDAGVSFNGDRVVFTHSENGQALRDGFSDQRVLEALKGREAKVKLPVEKVEPKVSDSTLGQTLVIDLSENHLYLYDGFKVEKSYPVATAMPGFETPVGSWQIVNKAENPTWVNPDPTGWGAGAPASIPPGPGNPLGTRALYLDAPGIRIHGTYDTASVGTYASHGCIRMTISDAEDLYPRVTVGTPVIIKA